MKILLVGCWLPSEEEKGLLFANPDSPTLAALEEIESGLVRASVDAQVRAFPFGPREAFAQAIGTYYPQAKSVVIGRSDTSGSALGRWLRAEDSHLLIVEGGHQENHDWGIPFLQEATCGHVDDSPTVENLIANLDVLAGMLRDKTVIFSYSDPRPLTGPTSTSLLTTELTPRGSELAGGGRNLLAALVEWEKKVGYLSSSDLSRLPGSGAGGGIAAILTAAGALLQASENVLRAHTPLDEKILWADLVVMVQRHLHGTDLATSPLAVVSQTALAQGKPVVAAGETNSLSSHEARQWGIGAVSLQRKGKGLDDLGRRIGQTWIPRPRDARPVNTQ